MKKDIQESKELGVRGVPYFLLNGELEISGAQPEEVFLRALERLWEEKKKKVEKGEGGKCENGACKL